MSDNRDLNYKNLEEISREIRLDIVEMSDFHQNGHIAPALSTVEILTWLYEIEMSEKDRFIMSKGHGCLSLFAVLRRKGLQPEITGHPDLAPEQGIYCTTGSLGQGIGIGAGKALAKKIRKDEGNIYVMLGDGECQEGAVWEALNIIRKCRLTNIVPVVDHNMLQALDSVENIMDEVNLADKFRAFGFKTFEIDGHSFAEIESAFNECRTSDTPAAIVARTIKGKGISFMENVPAWHTRLMSGEELIQARKDLSGGAV